jgi:hypothetical protein
VGYGNGVVSVPGTAVKICTVGPQGCLVQNLGAVVVTVGGPNVAVGQGPTLPATMTSPVFVPGGLVGVSGQPPNAAAVSEDLFGIGATAGPTNVVFVAPG